MSRFKSKLQKVCRCRAINNANVLYMGGFIVGGKMAVEMVKKFLAAAFTEGMDDVKDFLNQAYADIQEMERDSFSLSLSI